MQRPGRRKAARSAECPVTPDLSFRNRKSRELAGISHHWLLASNGAAKLRLNLVRGICDTAGQASDGDRESHGVRDSASVGTCDAEGLARVRLL